MEKPKNKRIEISLNPNKVDEKEILEFLELTYEEKKKPIAIQFKEAMKFYMTHHNMINSYQESTTNQEVKKEPEESLKADNTSSSAFIGFQGLSSD